MSGADVDLVSRWALGAQAGTTALLALFFLVLARTQSLTEVRLWAHAWAANAAAVLASFVLPLAEAGSWLAHLTSGLYAASKTAFGTLLLAGAQHHAQPGAAIPVPPLATVALLGVWGLAVTLFGALPPHLALGQAIMLAALLGAGAQAVLRSPRTPQSRWLGAGLLGAALLHLHYVPLLIPTLWGEPARDPGHLFLAPLVETALEVFVALGSLVALQGTVVASLAELNRELEESRAHLRQLVEVDPLTGLRNRRALRPFLTSARSSGATIIILDIDNFKALNDRHGHLVGDACLRRVADTLRETFRVNDGLFRWGGDEFLLICPGLDEVRARQRAAAFTQALNKDHGRFPTIRVSLGFSELSPGAEPDLALRQADAAMLAHKKSRPRG